MYLYKLIDCRLKLLRRHRLYKMDLEPGGTAAFDILLHSVSAECDRDAFRILVRRKSPDKVAQMNGSRF